MEELNEFQKKFFEELKNIQEGEIVDSLYGKHNYDSITNEGDYTLPQAVIYNVREIDFEDIEYDQSEMRSSEV